MRTTIKQLSDVAQVIMGQSPPGELYNTQGVGLPLITGAGQFGKLYPEPKQFSRSGVRLSKESDIIICIRATIGDLNWSDRTYYLGRGVAAIRPLDAVDRRYLWHWLKTQQQILERRATGSTFKQVKRDDVENLLIPVPTLEEQRYIAAVLDKGEALREMRHQAINKLATLLRSIFLDMFGDPILNPKDWDTLPLGAVVADKGAIVDGPFGSSLKPDNYVTRGVRVIRNFNIKDDEFDDSEFKYISDSKFKEIARSEVVSGDVLMSTKGTVGNVCLMPELNGKSVLSATGTVRVRLPGQSDIDPEFLVSQMTLPPFKQYIKTFQAGSNQKYLNLAAIRKIRVFVPPKEMQMRFRELKGAIKKSLESMEQSRIKAEQLFLSIQQRAFEGELCHRTVPVDTM